MMAEFAFTPWVFDEKSHPDPDAWRDQLRELGHGMFPKTAVSPVIVANLGAGCWHDLARRVVEANADHRTKGLCLSLLQKMAPACVHRPIKSRPLRIDELAWGNEAIGSATDEHIERILTTPASHASLKHPSVCGIADVPTDGFWKDISPEWSPPAIISEQVKTLRKLCVHSEFLWLISPEIKGVSNDETDFAVAVIREAFRRPSGYPRVDIEIHVEGPQESKGASDFPDRLRKRTNNIVEALKAGLIKGQQVRLVVWERLLERLAIAGFYTEHSTRQRIRSPRWGVYMGHVARKTDAKDGSNEWKLLNPERVEYWFLRYCDTNLPVCLNSVVVHK